KINHVVIYSNNTDEVEKAAGNLLRMKQEWPLLYLADGAAIFGWRDPLLGPAGKKVAADPFTGLEKNLDQLAYSPKEERTISATGSEHQPQRFHWWQAFWKRRPFHNSDLREARLALAAYEALAPIQHSRNALLWNNTCASAG